MFTIALTVAVAVAVSWLLRRLLRPPSNLAPGLPVIPVWVAFLPLLRLWLKLPLPGQDETYARYIAPQMAKHGAVVVFFGSQWNVLVGCPEGMKQLFAEEKTTYHKSGNHKKLPRAVISALTGGNIISETGMVHLDSVKIADPQAWKKFAEVIRPALKDSIRVGALELSRSRLIAEIRKASGSVVAVTGLVQRYSMESVCLCVFGRDLKVSGSWSIAENSADGSFYQRLRTYMPSTRLSSGTSFTRSSSAYQLWTSSRGSSHHGLWPRT